ncbi:hypothetical protein [Herbiconiux sp. UC225_62]|uniref:hypothetical protein n=1 Tax=Herbiconiux sp. UC225_62 TaxID=3350168 RepID=UPI0036D221EF
MTEIDQQELDIKPTTFARGVPKQAHNAFYGIEDELIETPVQTQFTAIVTYRLSDVTARSGKGVIFPEISVDHIELVRDEKRIAEAKAIQVAEYKTRTGADTLDVDFEGGDDE